MIFSYAEAFGMLPKDVENEITELDWFEWFCYKANKNANEIFQNKRD
jgi:hypothetical protein